MSDVMSRPVVIFGTGELAQLAHFYFTHDSTRQVAGFTVDAQYIDVPEYLGLPLVSCEHGIKRCTYNGTVIWLEAFMFQCL